MARQLSTKNLADRIQADTRFDGRTTVNCGETPVKTPIKPEELKKHADAL